jgi:hypothetical protein
MVRPMMLMDQACMKIADSLDPRSSDEFARCPC